MRHTPLPKFRTTLGFITLICGFIITHQTFSANIENPADSTSKQGVGKVLGISGWYERYGNGQIVLYPIVNLPTKDAMYTMGNMYGMVSMFPMYSMGMLGMGGPYSMGGMLGMGMGGMANNMTSMMGLAKMYGMLDMYGLAGGYQMSFGRFWINDEGQLVLYPVNNMSGMGGMMGMGGMSGMMGMGGMSGMNSMNGMKGMK